MKLKYAELRGKPRILQSLTGLNVEEFERLLQSFGKAWEEFVEMLSQKSENDFEQGWAQCLAELIAGDRLNQHTRPIYGIVTDGKTWEFGYLEQQVFTKDQRTYTISNVKLLLATINGLFFQSTQTLS